MSRYIDAELIEYERHEKRGLGIDYGIDEESYYEVAYKKNIDKIPTADVIEVKHGHWSKEMYECVDAFGDRHIGYLCSNCKQVANKMNYCGNCGAIMDEETK